MRTQPFKREIRRIRNSIFHSFHDRTRTKEPTHTAWRTVRGDRAARPGLTIFDAMEKCPIAVGPESSLSDALALMIENHVSGLPVVDAEGQIVGALNESDLLKIFYEPEATNVASVMTRDPALVSVLAPMVDLVDQLMSSDFRRVLVHKDRRLVGIITRAHLMPAILEALKEEVCARPSAWTRMPGPGTQH